jgi:hypothetical protein
MKKHAAPIIATILLLLPVLYVGSFYALVLPHSKRIAMTASGECEEVACYRFGSEYSRNIFWPLEQIDRKLRPGTWRPEPIVY